MRTARLIAILVPLLNTAVLACPFCKDSVPNSDSQSAASVPSGFNNSVYFMLGGLFVVLSLIAGVIIRGVRDTNSRHIRDMRGSEVDRRPH